MVTIKDNIFKAYDIRGKYPEEVNKDVARAIAKALVRVIKGRNMVVGYDDRKTSPELAQAIVDTLVHIGVNVLEIEEATTPLFYFAINHLNADGGIMVTASHLPEEFNGFKLTRQKAVAVLPEEVRGLAHNSEIKIYSKGKIISKKNVSDKYIDFLLKKSKVKRAKLSISLGVRGKGLDIAERILNKLKAKIENNASLNFKFDTDGDRLMVNDIKSDYLFGILAKEELDRFNILHPKFIYDLRFSKSIPEFIKSNEGEAIKNRVGRVFIQEAMRKNGAILGGEISGHFYFKDTAYMDDAMYAMLRFIKISNEKGRLEDLAEEFEKYYHSGEINIKFDGDFTELTDKLEKKYNEANIERMDGLTVEYSDWWFNIRSSNTESLLRLVVEAHSEELMKKRVEEIKKATSFLQEVA